MKCEKIMIAYIINPILFGKIIKASKKAIKICKKYGIDLK